MYLIFFCHVLYIRKFIVPSHYFQQLLGHGKTIILDITETLPISEFLINRDNTFYFSTKTYIVTYHKYGSNECHNIYFMEKYGKSSPSDPFLSGRLLSEALLVLQAASDLHPTPVCLRD